MTFDEATKWTTAIEKIVAILKRRFPNLTTEETLKLAHELGRAAFVAMQEEKP